VILLCGGTGELGGRIALRLAERGVPFRALVRPGSEVRQLQESGAELVRGDLRDAASLAPSTDGVETVITTVTSIERLLSGKEKGSLLATDQQGTANLVAAAERAGVQRFVYLSFPGMEDVDAPLPNAKRAIEALLRKSPVREVIVRPSMFQEIWLSPVTGLDWANGKLTVFGKGESRRTYVATDAAAEAVFLLALHDDPPTVVDFGGPDRLTRNEVCDLVERAAGHSLKRRHVPRLALRVGTRVLARPRPALASTMGMALASDLRDDTTDTRALTELGIGPLRSAKDYIEQQVGRPAA
jgi:uncharacterized protein YbjT (DUF2867 family)